LTCKRNGLEPARFPELARARAVLFEQFPGDKGMDKKLDDKLDPKAKGKKTAQSDFDRNRDGLYGGLPQARDPRAPGPASKQPHPER
jgi:hypothetical protein